MEEKEEEEGGGGGGGDPVRLTLGGGGQDSSAVLLVGGPPLIGGGLLLLLAAAPATLTSPPPTVPCFFSNDFDSCGNILSSKVVREGVILMFLESMDIFGSAGLNKEAAGAVTGDEEEEGVRF